MFIGQYPLFDNAWEDYFALFVAVILCFLVFKLMRHPNQQTAYQADRAWLQAGIYFCLCFILSWGLGVFKVITRSPIATTEQLSDPTWIAFAIVCLIVEIVAYYVIWRKGTLSHGRPLALASILIFGLLWGISEGMLFLSIWAILDWFIPSTMIVGIVAFIIISAFLGIWHSQYWDIHIAPEHNIIEWNLRKVLFAHIPNLLVTLTFFAIYSNAGLFVFYQTVALLGSTYFMRFPSYSYQRA